MALVTL